MFTLKLPISNRFHLVLPVKEVLTNSCAAVNLLLQESSGFGKNKCAADKFAVDVHADANLLSLLVNHLQRFVTTTTRYSRNFSSS